MMKLARLVFSSLVSQTKGILMIACPKFPKTPKIMIDGAISLKLRGPLIIFEKEMTNKRNNVDSKCYANYVGPKLAQFYNEQRIEIQSRMG